MNHYLFRYFLLTVFLLSKAFYSKSQCKIDYTKYQVLFNEDFSSYSLNRSIQVNQLRNSKVWIFNMDDNGEGHHGQECLPTDKHDPSFVEILSDPDGGQFCRLYAKPRTYSQILSNPDRKYNAGMLRIKFNQPGGLSSDVPATSENCEPWNSGIQYGIIEIVCKKPSGNPYVSDTWPAFWGIGTDNEIDIIDDAGDNVNPSKVWNCGYIDWGMKPTYHEANNPWTTIGSFPSRSLAQASCGCDMYDYNRIYPSGSKVVMPRDGLWYVCKTTRTAYATERNHTYYSNTSVMNLGNAYNTYTAAWTPEKITYFVNGREMFTHYFDVMVSNCHCPISIIADLQIYKNFANISMWIFSILTATGYTLPTFHMDIKRITIYKGLYGNNTNYKSDKEYVHFNSINMPTPSNHITNIAGSMTFNPDKNAFYYISSDYSNNSRHLCGINPDISYSRFPLSYSVSGTWANKQPYGEIAYNKVHKIIVFRDKSNYIRYLYESSPDYWSYGNFLPFGSPDLVLAGGIENCIKVAGNGDIVYIGNDRKIHKLYYSSGTWQHELNFSLYNTPSELAKGDLCVGINTENVFYKSVNDEVLDVWSPPGHHYIEHLSTDPSWKVDPAPGSMDLDYTHTYLYFKRKNNGRLSYFYWNSSLSEFTPQELSFTYTHPLSENVRNGVKWDGENGVLYFGYYGRLQYVKKDGLVWKHSYIDDYFNTEDFICPMDFWSSNISFDKILPDGKFKTIAYTDKNRRISFFKYCNCENGIPPYTANSFGSSPFFKSVNFDSLDNDTSLYRDDCLMPLVKDSLEGNVSLEKILSDSDSKLNFPCEYVLYPTCILDYLHVKTDLLGENTFCIFNSLGQKIDEGVFVNNLDIDMTQYLSGFYIVKLSNKDVSKQCVYKVLNRF